MDLASATDQLYASSPDDFVERRKSLVAEARAAKDRALATAIGKLRRPTRSAWLVNLYAREAPAELGALLELGAALQAAQAQLSGPELRRLSGERHKTLAAATRSAVALGESRGYTATEVVRQEVTQTLQAALADPEVADQLRGGVVTEAHTYGGFGGFGGFGGVEAAPTAEGAEAAGAAVPAIPAAPDAPEDEGVTPRAEAEERLRESEAALGAAVDEADEATERADALSDRIESLRTELAEAELAEKEAQREARAARKKVMTLETEVRAARAAYEAR